MRVKAGFLSGPPLQGVCPLRDYFRYHWADGWFRVGGIELSPLLFDSQGALPYFFLFNREIINSVQNCNSYSCIGWGPSSKKKEGVHT